MRIQTKNPEAAVKRAFWLAWQACGGPLGMGVFQDHPDATEDDVWQNVGCQADYPGSTRESRPGEAYGDYVFGRMMKLSIDWNVAEISSWPSVACWIMTSSVSKSVIRRRMVFSRIPVKWLMALKCALFSEYTKARGVG